MLYSFTYSCHVKFPLQANRYFKSLSALLHNRVLKYKTCGMLANALRVGSQSEITAGKNRTPVVSILPNTIILASENFGTAP